MKLFTYNNYADAEKDTGWKGEALAVLLKAASDFPTVQVVCESILEADEAYEAFVGISPSRYKKHTPPILVSIT